MAIRNSMHEVGGVLLEKLLAADDGYRGHRVDCGKGHQATFVEYRTKTVQTVLSEVKLRRAYYLCSLQGGSDSQGPRTRHRFELLLARRAAVDGTRRQQRTL